jgi:hypothetical protein
MKTTCDVRCISSQLFVFSAFFSGQIQFAEIRGIRVKVFRVFSFKFSLSAPSGGRGEDWGEVKVIRVNSIIMNSYKKYLH